MARKRREYTAAERKELWQRWKQGEPIAEVGEQEGAGLRAKALAVRAHLYGFSDAVSIHLQGEAS